MMDADAIIHSLGLAPHPEGGFYREVYREAGSDGGRGDVTTIYFLLKANEISRWHRIDATEIWHYYGGASLTLRIAERQGARQTLLVGMNLSAGERPVAIVPKDAWQSAKSNGEWTLLGCSVAPAFEFAGFEMAADGWTPQGSDLE